MIRSQEAFATSKGLLFCTLTISYFPPSFRFSQLLDELLRDFCDFPDIRNKRLDNIVTICYNSITFA